MRALLSAFEKDSEAHVDIIVERRNQTHNAMPVRHKSSGVQAQREKLRDKKKGLSFSYKRVQIIQPAG